MSATRTSATTCPTLSAVATNAGQGLHIQCSVLAFGHGYENVGRQSAIATASAAAAVAADTALAAPNKAVRAVRTIVSRTTIAALSTSAPGATRASRTSLGFDGERVGCESDQVSDPDIGEHGHAAIRAGCANRAMSTIFTGPSIGDVTCERHFHAERRLNPLGSLPVASATPIMTI